MSRTGHTRLRPWSVGKAPAAAALVILSAASGALAQSEQPRLTGYLEHQFSVARTPSGWAQLDYDRLRLDLDARGGRDTRISAGMIWQIYRGRTRIVLTELVPASVRDQLPATAVLPVRERHYLNHLYLTLRSGAFDLTAGKHYLAWGRGLVFNPTELFRPKNLYDPAYEREGVGALSASLEIGPLSDLTIVYVPEAGYRQSGKVARLRTHAAGVDLSALAAERWERDPVAGLLGQAAPTQQCFTLGGDLSAELFGVGLWLEGAWSEREGTEWIELTAGGNLTLPGNILFNLEGYFDGRGKWRDPYPLADWLALATGARRTIGRGMLFASLSRPTGDRLALSLAGLANTSDRSTVLLPALTYAFAENVDLFVQGIVALGPDGTEFGTRGHGGLLRARAYF